MDIDVDGNQTMDIDVAGNQPNGMCTFNFDDTEVPLELTRNLNELCVEIETKKRLYDCSSGPVYVKPTVDRR